MNRLPTEIRSIIVSKLDCHSVCQLIITNKELSQSFSQKFWEQLLAMHFKQSISFKHFNAKRSYQIRSNWPVQIKFFFAQFLQQLKSEQPNNDLQGTNLIADFLDEPAPKYNLLRSVAQTSNWIGCPSFIFTYSRDNLIMCCNWKCCEIDELSGEGIVSLEMRTNYY